MLKAPAEVQVLVDSREFRSPVVRILYDKGVKLINKQLAVGDYVVSDRVVIERKTTVDFENSIMNARIFKQAEELTDNFERPVIIIEGPVHNGRIHPNAVRGAIASLTTDFGIPVINVEDSDETAFLIIAYARREQSELKRSIVYNAKRKGLTDKQTMESIIASFPNFGAQIAKNLLIKFKNIKSIINAGQEELIKVDKVGKLKAKRFTELINKKYK